MEKGNRHHGRFRWKVWVIGLAVHALTGADLPASAASIESMLKPSVYRSVLSDREIATQAKLEDAGADGIQHYSIYAIMLVHAPLARTRAVLTNYPLYAQLIPYIDRSDYQSDLKLLWIEGGIFGFRLSSRVGFDSVDPASATRIGYRIVSGHLTGLSGEIRLEDQGERGTLVAFMGNQAASEFPPRFVMERGAEIVFGFTAKRMRSYIEEQEKAGPIHSPVHPSDEKSPSAKSAYDPQATPQPRSHL